MAICKFYASGNCRYGNSCNFEHIGAQQNRWGSSSTTTAAAAASKYNEASLKTDLVEARPQWKLSVYGPAKEEPNLIVGTDRSCEEDRYLYYTSMRTTNNTSQYMTGYEQLFNQMETQTNAIVNNPTAAIQHYEKEKLNRASPFSGSGAAKNSLAPFTGSTGGAFGKPSAFGSTGGGGAFGQSSAFGQTATPSAFGSNSSFGSTSALGSGSAFGSTSALGNSGSAFGSTSALGSGSAFGSTSALGSGSAFGSTSTLGSGSAFGSTSALGGNSAFGQPSAFGQAAKPASAFGATNTSGSAFGSTSTLGSGSAFGSTSALGSSNTGAFGASPAFGATSGLGNGSAFGQTLNSSNNGFGSNSSTTGMGAFGAANNTNATFSSTSTIPQTMNDGGMNGGDSTAKPSELEAFSAPQFTYRAIPEVEPPAQFR
ncbi:hypothetical protein BD560DRAFT_405149 [Blakeslea trispora]|nr:hypothetical protein BD560DRAFT_405149 [Blakeslea trispora]